MRPSCSWRALPRSSRKTDRIVTELRRTPLMTIAEARRTPEAGGVPDQPGFYAWWVQPGALPDVPPTPHPTELWNLLYVGIAPDDAESKIRLRSRVLEYHCRRNVGSSTFRFDLASLLFEREGWKPTRTTTRPKLVRDDNRALREWQEKYLRIRWAIQPEPWTLEGAVIAVMRPPLNLAQNTCHPFYAVMKEARARFRDESWRTIERP